MSGDAHQRVFAVAGSSADVVRLYGFGLYVGDRRRPGTVDFADLADSDKDMYRVVIRDADARPPIDPTAFYLNEVAEGRMTQAEADSALAAGFERAEAQRQRPLDDRASELHERCALNPLIVLDNGDEVWGCECWWGPIERWPEVAEGRTVVEVSIVQHRTEAGIAPGRNLAVPGGLPDSTEGCDV